MAEDRRRPINDADDLARRAAAILAEQHPAVVPQVEAELETRCAPSEPRRFDPATMIGLGGLIVMVAQFTYMVWRDRRKDQQLAPEALKRRVERALDDQGYPNTIQRAQVIDAVIRAVEEAQR